jgi:tetratricopeptide (TPR) repeat protein
MNNLAGGYWSAKRLDRSIPLFEESLRLLTTKMGRNHPNTLQTVGNLGVNYKDAGRPHEALPLLEEAVRAGRDHPVLVGYKRPLVEVYLRVGEFDKATALAKEYLAEARVSLPADGPELSQLLVLTGLNLLMARAWTDAEPVLRECVSLQEKREPDAWMTFFARALLGRSLLGQGKYAEAESLLLAGYEGMMRREAVIPPLLKVQLPRTMEALVLLYEATNKAAEAAKWRKHLYADAEPAPPPRTVGP